MDKRTRAKFSSIAARIGSLEQGVGGGYYIPSVDGNGNLTWEASKSNMPSVDGANIKGPKGDTGATGAQGSPGTAGKGVPTGGTAGQVLAKVNSTDYNTQWVDPPGGSGTVDSTMTQETYTSFLNSFAGSVVVCQKMGMCFIHGYVKPSSVSTSFVDVLSADEVPAPQHGTNITPTVASWYSASDAAARVRIKASGGLAFARGTANREYGFAIAYPIAS